MTATTTAAPETTHSAAIRSQDFRPYLDDKRRDYWTVEILDHVIDALDGAPVAIVADRMTGYAEVGVRLVSAHNAYRSGMSSPRLRVERTHADGSTSVTDYRIDGIGDTIIPLAEPMTAKAAKWRALDAARKAGLMVRL